MTTIRLLHHLARTGGTLISRCLSGMRGVTVLSEVHPAGAGVARQFDPLFQAQYWYKLLPAGEAQGLRDADAPFAARIAAIAARAAERDERLVLRAWSHLDYIGRPFIPAPAGRLALREALADTFRVVETTTVRHPAAQWLSWERFVPAGGVSLAEFMAGVRAFAEDAAAIGFLRYEDLCANPDHGLAELCWRLELDFDPEYAYRWFFCRTVSGDLDGLDRYRIEPVGPPRLTAEVADALDANADYHRALELLGYDHVGTTTPVAAAALR